MFPRSYFPSAYWTPYYWTVGGDAASGCAGYWPGLYFTKNYFAGYYWTPSGFCTTIVPPTTPIGRPYADPGGGGGSSYLTGKKATGKLTMHLPRVYTRQPELPYLHKDLWHPDENLEVPIPIGAEAERQARWAVFRQKTQASYPEFIAYEWLRDVKKRVPDVDFYFQYSFLGGRTSFGGFVLDFFFPIDKIAWFIQGLHFHYTNPDDRGRDIMAIQVVASRGVNVVQVFEDDIIQRTEYTLDRAYLGQQIQRSLT